MEGGKRSFFVYNSTVIYFIHARNGMKAKNQDSTKVLKNKHILVIGLTSVKLGALEKTNIGNYLIVDPMFKYLRQSFPSDLIRTTLQLSPEFLDRYDIVGLADERFWTYRPRTLLISLKDNLLFGVYSLARLVLGESAKKLLAASRLLTQLDWADMVVDFSGDLYGDNAPLNRFIEETFKLQFAVWMKKPLILFASSPGPFTKNFLYHSIGKRMLNRATVILNREPQSSLYLKNFGIDGRKIVDTACPSFLFDRKTVADIAQILKEEGIDPKQPKVGLIVSGWNMPTPPFDKVPREKSDFANFLEVIGYFTRQGVQVVLISHSNRVGPDSSLIPGPDHTICKQIYAAMPETKDKALLKVLSKAYDPETMRGIIASLDFLVSGRLHAAISGLSQCVPTVIVDYGFPPKGHKLLGIAKLMGIEDLFCDPNDKEKLLAVIAGGWQERAALRRRIEKNLVGVKKQAELNFSILKDLSEKSVK